MAARSAPIQKAGQQRAEGAGLRQAERPFRAAFCQESGARCARFARNDRRNRAPGAAHLNLHAPGCAMRGRLVHWAVSNGDAFVRARLVFQLRGEDRVAAVT